MQLSEHMSGVGFLSVSVINLDGGENDSLFCALMLAMGDMVLISYTSLW